MLSQEIIVELPKIVVAWVGCLSLTTMHICSFVYGNVVAWKITILILKHLAYLLSCFLSETRPFWLAGIHYVDQVVFELAVICLFLSSEC